MDDLVAMLRAVGEPNRLRIMALCARGDLSVSELTRILGQSQPGVSRNLRLLCEAGVLERYQEGSRAYFHLPATGPGAEVARYLVSRIGSDDPVVVRDQRRLEEIRDERAERSEAYFRENAAQWDRIRALHVDETEVEANLRELAGTLKSGSMLDIGTGTGRMLQVLGSRVRDAVGVDQSHDMLAFARASLSDGRHVNCSVRQGSMYDLPFDAESFDLVVLHMVLHFAERPQEVFSEASRVLKPGGTFLVADFAPHELDALRDEHEHLRLGFRGEEIENWSAASSLACADERTLPGGRLTVKIWKLRKVATVRGIAEARPLQEAVR